MMANIFFHHTADATLSSPVCKKWILWDFHLNWRSNTQIEIWYFKTVAQFSCVTQTQGGFQQTKGEISHNYKTRYVGRGCSRLYLHGVFSFVSRPMLYQLCNSLWSVSMRGQKEQLGTLFFHGFQISVKPIVVITFSFPVQQKGLGKGEAISLLQLS